MNESFQESIEKAIVENQRVITMLTDFGNENGYTGVMKGVILQIAPQARIIDITHDIPPLSISAAAFINEWSYGYFPVGAIHLCVVDPGVGTRRRILAVEYSGHLFVAPDNGLLTPILEKENVAIRCASNQRYWLDKISNTFHGRDILSPLAAHLANGVALEEMGEIVSDPIRLHAIPPKINPDSIVCHVRYIDRFGNLITSLDYKTYRDWSLQCGCDEKETLILFQDQCIVGISQAYGDKIQGELLATFNGYDRLEIAIAGGCAARAVNIKIDAPVKVCASWAS